MRAFLLVLTACQGPDLDRIVDDYVAEAGIAPFPCGGYEMSACSAAFVGRYDGLRQCVTDAWSTCTPARARWTVTDPAGGGTTTAVVVHPAGGGCRIERFVDRRYDPSTPSDVTRATCHDVVPLDDCPFLALACGAAVPVE